MSRRFLVSALIPYLLLCAAFGAERRMEPSKWELEPVFTVPRLDGDVRIDAVLADNEWAGATRVSAVFDASMHIQSVQPATFWLCWRGQALCLAFRMQRPKGCLYPRITDETKGYTSNNLFQKDDNLEVWLAPLTKGVVPTGMMEPQYAIAANAGGAYYHVMTRYPHDKIPRDLKYVPYFDYNTGVWQGELRFPWSIFQVMDVAEKRPPGDGVEWKAVIFFHQVTPAKNYIGLQPRLDWIPTLRFSERPISFAVSALSLTQPGEACLHITINNQSPRPAEYLLDYEVYRRKSVPRSDMEQFFAVWGQIERIKKFGPEKAAVKQGEIQNIKTIADVENELNQVYTCVDAGQRQVTAKAAHDTACDLFFAAPDGYYVLRYALIEKDSGQVVMRQVIPAMLFRMSLEVKPEFLLKKMIVVRANIAGLSELAKGDTIVCSLCNTQGEPLERVQVEWDGASQIITALLPTTNTEEGKEYAVSVQAFHNGKLIGNVSQSVRRPPRPEWFGHTLGTTKKIPWGYQPIKFTEDSFEIVLRKYVMAGKSFPQQIIVRGEPLLAGPIELTACAEGKPLNFTWGKYTLKCATDTEAEFEQELRANNLVVNLRARLEYDGFIRYDLDLMPSQAGAILDNLTLQIPILAKYANWFSHESLSTDLAGFPCPAYPYGALDDFFKDHPNGWIPFTFAFFLGCRDRGIEWVAEDDRAWVPEDEARMIHLERSADRVTFRIQFVGKPVQLKEARTVSFGLIAAPVRQQSRERYYSRFKAPLTYRQDEDWTQFNKSLTQTRAMGFNYFNLYINASDLNLFSNARYYDAKTLENFTQYARAVHRAGGQIVYYCGYGLPHGIPDDDTFGSEMRMEPVTPSGWYNHASPFADYWLHSVKFMCDHCGLDGIQTDGICVVPLMTNPTYNYEWFRDGKRHGTYPVFAVRELMKRLYIMLKFELQGGREGFHTLHCDRPPVYSIDGWCDYALSGEAHHYTVSSLRELFPHRYGVFYDTLEKGIAPYALWSYERGIAVTRNMAYTLHHLHGVRTDYGARLGAYGPAYEITGGFNDEAKMWSTFNLGQAEFRPWWKHPDLVLVESDDPEVRIPKDAIYVSAFVHHGKSALLVVANLDHVGYALKLSPNLSALDLPGNLEQYDVRDPILGCGIFTRPKIRVDIYPQRWRALLIQQRK